MFSNQTPNYGLPQYEQNDTLNVLSDFNGAMETIDSTMKTNELAAASAQSKADGADTKANNNATAIGDLQTAQGADRTDINTLTGAVNTINSLIGNGEPTTTDKTLIGAINEINSDVSAIDTKLTNHGVLINSSNIATVTADGVKTMATLLGELKAAFDAEIALHSDRLYIPTTLFITGYGVLDADTHTVLDSNGTIGTSFKQIFIGTTSVGVKSVTISTTPHADTGDMSSDGYTYTNHDGDVPASGDVLVIGALVFQK